MFDVDDHRLEITVQKYRQMSKSVDMTPDLCNQMQKPKQLFDFVESYSLNSTICFCCMIKQCDGDYVTVS